MKTKSILLITLSLIASTYASAASFDGVSTEKEKGYQDAKQVAVFAKPAKQIPMKRVAALAKPAKQTPMKRVAALAKPAKQTPMKRVAALAKPAKQTPMKRVA